MFAPRKILVAPQHDCYCRYVIAPVISSARIEIQIKLYMLSKMFRAHKKFAIIARSDADPHIEIDSCRHDKTIVIASVLSNEVYSTRGAINECACAK